MGQKFERMIPLIVAVVCAAVLPMPRAGAQAVSLQEQLAAQYKAAKLGSDTSGYSVTEEGTLLAIQKGGMLGSPYSEKTTLANKYEGGVVHPPSGLLLSGKKAIFGHFSTTLSLALRDRGFLAASWAVAMMGCLVRTLSCGCALNAHLTRRSSSE